MKLQELFESAWKAHPTRKGVLMRKIDLKAEEQKKVEAEAEKNRKKAERAMSATAKKDAKAKFLLAVADKVTQQIAEVFPDADPIDNIVAWVKKRKGDLFGDIDAFDLVDKAVKQHLDAKDYNAYIKEFWDQIADDKIVPGVTRENNPW